MENTSFFEVYKRAITEFKDPTLKSLLDNNTILFSETMYNFLKNAISLFTNPLKASERVHNITEPYTITTEFISDGVSDTIVLDTYPEDGILDDCIFEVKVNGELADAEYIKEEHSIKFNTIPSESSDIVISIYYAGRWNIKLYDEEVYLLSQFIVACWSEFIANDKLDIIRLLGDTDFKLSSNATTTQAKTHWNVVNREVVNKRMNKYAWDCMCSKRYM